MSQDCWKRPTHIHTVYNLIYLTGKSLLDSDLIFQETPEYEKESIKHKTTNLKRTNTNTVRIKHQYVA